MMKNVVTDMCIAPETPCLLVGRENGRRKKEKILTQGRGE